MKRKLNKSENWFDTECKNIRKNLRKLSNQKHNQPYNSDLHLKYCQTLKEYKNTLKQKKLKYLHKTLNDIEESVNQSQFWDLWNNLSTAKQHELAINDGAIWKKYFKNLYCKISKKTHHTMINEHLNKLELIIKDNQNPLDKPISHKELIDKLQSLKSKKSCDLDGIKNEMLKNCTPEMHEALLKLFNLVLSSGCFPDIWNQGLISPIYKSGDKLDPNNYRGICVSSNLGKVFCCIINSNSCELLPSLMNTMS